MNEMHVPSRLPSYRKIVLTPVTTSHYKSWSCHWFIVCILENGSAARPGAGPGECRSPAGAGRHGRSWRKPVRRDYHWHGNWECPDQGECGARRGRRRADHPEAGCDPRDRLVRRAYGNDAGRTDRYIHRVSFGGQIAAATVFPHTDGSNHRNASEAPNRL